MKDKAFFQENNKFNQVKKLLEYLSRMIFMQRVEFEVAALGINVSVVPDPISA